MAFLQDSVVQSGCNAGAVADDIDYGPYTSDQWTRLFETLFASDQAATQGIVRGFLDELEVTGAGATITVKQGAGLCNGHFLIGEGAPNWSLAMTPPTAGHTRCDYVVMLENNTAGVYAPGVATMECPGTADYGGVANQVPEYSCRLAVVKGAEDAACPPGSLSQTTNLWMTPLASVEWNVTQTIETVTDLRRYIHEFEQTVFIQAVYESDAGGAYVHRVDGRGWPLADNQRYLVSGNWQIPPEYVPRSTLTVTAVVNADATGNMVSTNHIDYGAVGEAYNNHTDVATDTVDAIGFVDLIYEVNAVVLDNGPIAIGDYLSIWLQRDGLSGSDTISGTVYFMGWLITYTAAIPWS